MKQVGQLLISLFVIVSIIIGLSVHFIYRGKGIILLHDNSTELCKNESTAWKTLTAHPNSLVRILPARAMAVVQEMVGTFRALKNGSHTKTMFEKDRGLGEGEVSKTVVEIGRSQFACVCGWDWKGFVRHEVLLPSHAINSDIFILSATNKMEKEARVIIATPMGRLRGRVQAYKSGLKSYYYGFRGIRYGLPPVGARRFREALPERPWKGIRDAIKEGSTCPHRNVVLETYKGSEDCLFLNVFTARLPDRTSHPRLPVMVWFHGGGFSFGSGNSFLYGPDFLVAEDVILVTLNYRLGPIGFLSVEPDAPGNAGLKDQILALKWVKKNIAAFGGDPDQVTIFGESAGGSSVHYLLLSSMAKGLFHRAISESGSAFNPWAMADEPRARAFSLGRVLGFNTTNTTELLAFLRQIPAKKLIDGAAKTITPEDARKNIGLPFVPSIEGAWDGNGLEDNTLLEKPFLTENPRGIAKTKSFNKVPYLAGYNSHEAMLFMRRLRKDPTLLETMNNDFVRLVPLDLKIPGGAYSPEAEKLSKKIREFYLESRPVTEETIEEMIYLLTDIMFFRGIVDAVRMHAAYSDTPAYLYRFAFDGSLGLYKRMLGISRPGVCHGDELGYLFHFGFFNLSLDRTAPEILVKRRMVKMWTNFAKYGDPTPDRYDPTLSVKWNPVDGSNVTKALNYLDINARLESKVNPENLRLSFWDDIYSQYNGNLI